ncbi:MAG: serine acetyltransferase [candidate division WOR-3 bacterium]
MNLLEYIRDDILRYCSEEERARGVSKFRMLALLLTRQELWALTMYRIGRWIILNIQNPWIRRPIIAPWALLNGIVRVLSGDIFIYASAEIGKGLYLHHGPVVIGPGVKIGEYCNLSMMNVIGYGGRDDCYGTPTIGNRVFLGPGVVATGNIRIGDNVAVGANAVVNQDLPDNCTAAGVPARVVNWRGSEQLIEIRK